MDEIVKLHNAQVQNDVDSLEIIELLEIVSTKNIAKKLQIACFVRYFLGLWHLPNLTHHDLEYTPRLSHPEP